MDCKIAKDMNLTPAQIQAMRMDSTAGKTSGTHVLRILFAYAATLCVY